MSLFEMAAGSRYVKVVFDADELDVIRAACSLASAVANERMSSIADLDLEQASGITKKAIDSEMAKGLASIFKAGQEILIEREDLAPVLECLKDYGHSTPGEQAPALERAREKIERCCMH